MNTWDALRSRRNVRQYTDDPIAPSDLDRILEAGRRSPSARNRQWWDFVVCTNRSQLSELTGVWQGAKHIAGAAAAVAVIVEDLDDGRTRETMQYDLGQLTMSMMVWRRIWASAAAIPRYTTRSWLAPSWGCPTIGFAPG